MKKLDAPMRACMRGDIWAKEHPRLIEWAKHPMFIEAAEKNPYLYLVTAHDKDKVKQVMNDWTAEKWVEDSHNVLWILVLRRYLNSNMVDIQGIIPKLGKMSEGQKWVMIRNLFFCLDGVYTVPDVFLHRDLSSLSNEEQHTRILMARRWFLFAGYNDHFEYTNWNAWHDSLGRYLTEHPDLYDEKFDEYEQEMRRVLSSVVVRYRDKCQEARREKKRRAAEVRAAKKMCISNSTSGQSATS